MVEGKCLTMVVALSARISIASMKSNRKNREMKIEIVGNAMFCDNTWDNTGITLG